MLRLIGWSFAILGISVLSAAVPRPPARTYFVAHRYDESRVVFSLGKTFADDPALGRRSLSQDPSRMPDPVARLSGMALWKMDEAFWQRHAKDLPGPSPGDPWVIEAGGLSTFHCRIERLAVAEVACRTTIAAIAQVDPAEQEAFKLVRRGHYLIVSAENYIQLPASESAPALFSELPALSAAKREKLESVLQGLLQKELPRVHQASSASYAQLARMGEKNPWPERDERLGRGEGTLTYVLQGLRLTPDAGLRYFVRALWSLDNEPAFLLSAWIRPGDEMQVESAYSRPSMWQRMIEYQSERLGLEDLGILENVFDYDGDGWGEVLIGQRQSEGYRMVLLEYTEKRGLQRTGISYRYGC